MEWLIICFPRWENQVVFPSIFQTIFLIYDVAKSHCLRLESVLGWVIASSWVEPFPLKRMKCSLAPVDTFWHSDELRYQSSLGAWGRWAHLSGNPRGHCVTDVGNLNSFFHYIRAKYCFPMSRKTPEAAHPQTQSKRKSKKQKSGSSFPQIM